MFVIALAVVSLLLTAQPAQPVNPTAAALADFHKRVEAYVQMRERATSGVP